MIDRNFARNELPQPELPYTVIKIKDVDSSNGLAEILLPSLQDKRVVCVCRNGIYRSVKVAQLLHELGIEMFSREEQMGNSYATLIAMLVAAQDRSDSAGVKLNKVQDPVQAFVICVDMANAAEVEEASWAVRWLNYYATEVGLKDMQLIIINGREEDHGY